MTIYSRSLPDDGIKASKKYFKSMKPADLNRDFDGTYKPFKVIKWLSIIIINLT